MGLKSTYYLRNRAASEIEKATVVGDTDSVDSGDINHTEPTVAACSIGGEECESCQ